MGKVKTPKRAGASSSPYDRNSSSASKAAAAAAAKNNVFKFKYRSTSLHRYSLLMLCF